MSGKTENVDTDTGEATSVVDLWEDWYHVPVLGVLVAFMFWVRVQQRDAFTRDGAVYFRGNDAYYHFREVSYTVRHWPSTMPFDPWTHFPFGTASGGQFGSLFDQVIATAALIVGLGSPSDHTVRMVMLYAAPVFGVLTAIPVYYIGKRFGGRLTGVFAVFVLALLPGEILRRATVGFADHQVAEAFYHALSAMAVMAAIYVASQEKPVYEQVVDRDWEGLKRPVTYGVLAGLAIMLYIWTWPPGLIMIGITGVFLVVAMSLNYLRGRSPEPLAFAAVSIFGTVGLLSLVTIDVFRFGPNQITLLHVFAALGVAAGAAFMAWLGRVFDSRGIDATLYPVTVGGLIVLSVVFVAVALPDVYQTILNNFQKTFLGVQSDVLGTVGEAQGIPIEQVPAVFFREYGLLYVTGAAGLVWMAARVAMNRDYRPELLFVVVWTVMVTMMAITQQRFNYYLAIALVTINAWLFAQATDLIDLPTSLDALGDVEPYQVLTLLAVLLVVVAPLAPPLAPIGVVSAGQATGPGASVAWSDGANWLETNSPEPGQYGGATNNMSYYGTYEPTDDFAYPEGAYGVMSWWDYGHWITVQGERIPNANPFQQGPRQASSFLQSTDEQRAELILEALPNMENRVKEIDNMSNAEIRAYAENASERERSEDTRYVMIDNQMAGTKFAPITRWATPPDPDNEYRGTYFRAQRYNVSGGNQAQFTVPTDRYYDTMLARMYFDDASGLEHYRLVHEVDRFSIIGSESRINPQTGELVAQPKYREQYNLGPYTERWANLSASLQRTDRPVPLSRSRYMAHADIESRVKTYERVPGATLEGSVDTENRTQVLARVRLRATTSGRTFIYSQQTRTDEDGNFNITVPYSTSHGLDTDDGYTNESVVAVSNYSVQAGAILNFAGQQAIASSQGSARVDVPERAVVEGETIQIEMQAPSPPNGSSNSSNASSLTAPTAPASLTGGSTPAGSSGQTAVTGPSSATAPVDPTSLSRPDAVTAARPN